jgi:deleted in liver cancer protein
MFVLTVRAVTLASRYLIQSYGRTKIFVNILFKIFSSGCGKSKVTHLSRVDLMGRSHEWYTKAYGSVLTRSMIKLRDSFAHANAGPETKV